MCIFVTDCNRPKDGYARILPENFLYIDSSIPWLNQAIPIHNKKDVFLIPNDDSSSESIPRLGKLAPGPPSIISCLAISCLVGETRALWLKLEARIIWASLLRPTSIGLMADVGPEKAGCWSIGLTSILLVGMPLVAVVTAVFFTLISSRRRLTSRSTRSRRWKGVIEWRYDKFLVRMCTFSFW